MTNQKYQIPLTEASNESPTAPATWSLRLADVTQDDKEYLFAGTLTG